MIIIIVDHEPVAKGRPRVTTRGGFARAYTPSKTRKYEDIMREAAKRAMGDSELFEGALLVTMMCYMPIPKSVSKKQRELLESEETYHTKKPDLDNLAKTLDALNGIVWHDDSQIGRLVVEKRYSDWPRTKIVVEEIEL